MIKYCVMDSNAYKNKKEKKSEEIHKINENELLMQ